MSKIKLLTIIGARPQIIKAAALSRAIRTRFIDTIEEIIVHTGQHYDEAMSAVFFEEMGVPKENYNLNVGSKGHGHQTGQMLAGIEDILLKEKPDALVVYGDTNSTLAGALAAAKLLIPVVHIEAGLRSFNKTMPEEINRITADHVSTLLFSPSESGFINLVREGFLPNNDGPYTADNPKIYHCGDLMLDNSMYFGTVSEQKSSVINTLGLAGKEFLLATIHRNANTDDASRLSALFLALNNISLENNLLVALPLHPRTRKMLDTHLQPEVKTAVENNPGFMIVEPVGFLDMIALEKQAKMIITDSGGVQKEAYFFNKPCIILRPETEWVEIVDAGAAIIADADYGRIMNAFEELKNKQIDYKPIFGDGQAAEFMCEEILKHIKPRG
jgi:UDP-GlcNAc3NAcA epimerase